MKDKLIDTLQERFANHEMGVDPSTWSAISSQLAAANGSALSEVLKDKFSGHEAPVDPQVWDGISSQLGHGAAAGGGVAAGWWAGGLAAALLVGGLFWWSSEDHPASVEQPVPSKTAPAETQIVAPQAVMVPTAAPEAGDPQQEAVMPVAKKPTTTATSTPIAQIPPSGEEVVNAVWQELVKEIAAEPHFAERAEPVPVDVAPPGQLLVPSVSTPYIPTVPPPTVSEEHATAEGSSETEAELDPDIVPAATPQLYIPNVFSPQGDGVNDHLKVVGSNYQKVLVRIFSAQSNALVFRADNLDDQWNGRDLNNVPCPEGHYFYAIEVTGMDGNTESKGEVVKLFR